jgi:hypothetical protein
MFVNYCGSKPKNVEGRIKDAVLECRRQRGLLFKSASFTVAASGRRKGRLSLTAA